MVGDLAAAEALQRLEFFDDRLLLIQVLLPLFLLLVDFIRFFYEVVHLCEMGDDVA
jgi:hypothetical protein